MGGGGWGVGGGGIEGGREGGGRKREIIYLSLRYHHQNDSCIKTGSDENHFNVSLIVRNKSHKTVSADHNLLKRKESRSGFESRSFCLPG